MLPRAHAVVQVWEVYWGWDGAWLDVPASLMFISLLVGAIILKSKKIEART